MAKKTQFNEESFEICKGLCKGFAKYARSVGLNAKMHRAYTKYYSYGQVPFCTVSCSPYTKFTRIIVVMVPDGVIVYNDQYTYNIVWAQIQFRKIEFVINDPEMFEKTALVISEICNKKLSTKANRASKAIKRLEAVNDRIKQGEENE